MSRGVEVPMIGVDEQEAINTAGSALFDAVIEEKKRMREGLPKEWQGDSFDEWHRKNPSSREVWLRVAEKIPAVQKMREKLGFLFLYDWNGYGEAECETNRLLVYPKNNEGEVIDTIHKSEKDTLDEGYPVADKNKNLSNSGMSQVQEVRTRENKLLTDLKKIGVMDGGYFNATFGLHRDGENSFRRTDTLQYPTAFQLADIMIDATHGIHQITRTPNGSASSERIDELLGNKDQRMGSSPIDFATSREAQGFRGDDKKNHARIVRSIQAPTIDAEVIEILQPDYEYSPNVRVRYADTHDTWTNIEAAKSLHQILNALKNT